MTVIDKPHLDRAHVLDLLTQMVRIRRFEDKCAELYTQEKIRGFLHLYDGEEAIAAGIIPVLGEADRIVATYREHGHALARGVPMTAVMAEMYGKAEGCSGGRGGSMHIFDAATQLLRWERHRGRRPASGGRPRTRRSDARGDERHGLLLRRGGRGRGGVPRDDEPCGTVGPAGAVRLREQRLRDGFRDRTHGVGDRHLREGRRLRHRGRARRRHGRGRASRPPPAAPSHASARPGGRISSNAKPTDSARIPCSTHSSTAKRRRWPHGG